MISARKSTSYFYGLALLAAIGLPAASYAIQGALGLSLIDEGFLWYGAQRVMAGEVPMRDFQAYDFGRYYWSAAIMSLAGSKGILAMRMSNVIMQGLCLALATYLVVRASPRRNLVFSLLATGTFFLWMNVM